MKDMIEKLRNSGFVVKCIKPVYFTYIDLITWVRIKMDLGKLKRLNRQKRVYLLGIPTAANMGDMAQYYLILQWLREHYPDYDIVDFPSRSILYHNSRFLDILEKKLKKEDIIFFQSGYDTHDLGGEEDIMHKTVITRFPNQKMVMMPQTVYFKSKTREEESSAAYSRNRDMLFLARDQVSYEKAKQMFPKLKIVLYPDIVTTLIGKFQFQYERDGVLVCRRTDIEKFYSEEELKNMEAELRKDFRVDKTDTTIKAPNMFVRRDVKKYMMRLIHQFAHYKVIITDRYHGTIFGLASGTQVIVLKTTDHKVTTGIDWFQGIYDKFVYLADTPEQAAELARNLMKQKSEEKMQPYFKKEYYDHLFDLINQKREDEE